jgi:septum formation protein
VALADPVVVGPPRADGHPVAQERARPLQNGLQAQPSLRPQEYHRPVDVVLASASPRRAALLQAAGIPFTVEPADVDETPAPGESPEEYVLRVARAKARRIATERPGSVVLAADTTVVVGDRMLGKPGDAGEAAAMLTLLGGRTHEVLTAVVLVRGGTETADLARTQVRFLPLTASDVAWYVATGEPFGKAGAYAIQGLASRFVDRIEGSYTNVVGLPVSLVYRALCDAGWPDALDGAARGGRESR